MAQWSIWRNFPFHWRVNSLLHLRVGTYDLEAYVSFKFACYPGTPTQLQWTEQISVLRAYITFLMGKNIESFMAHKRLCYYELVWHYQPDGWSQPSFPNNQITFTAFVFTVPPFIVFYRCPLYSVWLIGVWTFIRSVPIFLLHYISRYLPYSVIPEMSRYTVVQDSAGQCSKVKNNVKFSTVRTVKEAIDYASSNQATLIFH